MTESLSPQDLLRQLLGGAEGSAAQLTDQARQLGARGEDMLVELLGGEDTPERRANIRHQAKLAGAAGGLALLLKSRSLRKMAALGGLAALGTIAYRGHKRGAMPTDFRDAIGLLKGESADARATVLLKAMVAAARADGTISADEKAIIDAHPTADADALAEILSTPADP